MVNTSAMTGGMARTPAERAFFTQGPEVSHFNYFANPKTAALVVEGLLRAEDADGGFKPVPAPELGVVPTAARRGGANRPVVFVLPGITGTVLAAKDRRVWIDLPQLAFGGLRRLAIDAPDVTAKEPLSRYYGALCTFFGLHTRRSPWATTGAARSSTTRATSAPSWVTRWQRPISRCGSSPTRWAAWSPARPSWTASSGSGSRTVPAAA